MMDHMLIHIYGAFIIRDHARNQRRYAAVRLGLNKALDQRTFVTCPLDVTERILQSTSELGPTEPRPDRTLLATLYPGPGTGVAWGIVKVSRSRAAAPSRPPSMAT
jgi:hypothetical protein